MRAVSLSAAILPLLLSIGCREVDDSRIPNMPVYISFTNSGMWDSFGVHGVGDSRRFILANGVREPTGFFYVTGSATGYGGVLLIYGQNPFSLEMGPLAYDLSCPVERSPEVRVIFDKNSLEAVCPDCHSHYNVYNRGGAAVSDPALAFGYGLKRYECGRTPPGGFEIFN